MNEETESVTVTIKGVDNTFTGDVITSPVQQAILFLMELDKEEREF